MERLAGAALAGLVRVLGLLSLGGQRRLGRFLGSLAWLSGGDAARTTRINLTRCFPDLDDRALRDIGRRSLQNAAMLLTEMGTLSHSPVGNWRRLARSIEGEDLLRRDADDPRGVLILVPHVGNWEFLALVLGGYSVTALYDPPRKAALEPLIQHARSRAGATMLPIDAAGLRAFYVALRTGGVTALLPDQVPERRAGVYAPFFGWPALTMTFAHRLLQRCAARVVFGVALRCDGGFDVRFSEAPPAIRDPDPGVSASAMNAAIESLVRIDPAQYQWAYRRFKRQPPGIPSPYLRR